MTQVLLQPLLRPEAVQTDLNAVGGLSETIADYGIMTVCGAILLIFAITMFNVIIKKSSKTDEEIIAKLDDIADTVNIVKNTHSLAAENFDKHNKAVYDEIEGVTSKISELCDRLNKAIDLDEQINKNTTDARDERLRINNDMQSLIYTGTCITKQLEKLSEFVEKLNSEVRSLK